MKLILVILAILLTVGMAEAANRAYDLVPPARPTTLGVNFQ